MQTATETPIVFPVYTTALRRPWRLWNVRTSDVLRSPSGQALSFRTDAAAARFAKMNERLFLQQSHPET